MRHSRGPDFSISRLKIHVFGHKLDTLCATRANPNLEFRALKSMFKVNNSTIYQPLVRTDCSVSLLKIHIFGQKFDFIRHSRGSKFCVSCHKIRV